MIPAKVLCVTYNINLMMSSIPASNRPVCVLQCVAVRCSVLQFVAMCCSVLQCVAVCCSVLQCVVHIHVKE